MTPSGGGSLRPRADPCNTAATAVALANTESHDLGLRLAWGLIASSTPTP